MTHLTSSRCIKLKADWPETSSIKYPATKDILWSLSMIRPSMRCLVLYSSLVASNSCFESGSGRHICAKKSIICKKTARSEIQQLKIITNIPNINLLAIVLYTNLQYFINTISPLRTPFNLQILMLQFKSSLIIKNRYLVPLSSSIISPLCCCLTAYYKTVH